VRILFVSGYFPWPLTNGGCQRRFHLAESLARRHEVTLVALAPEGPPVKGWGACPLRTMCRRVIEFDARALVPVSSRRFDGWGPIGERVLEIVSSPAPLVYRYWNSARRLARFFNQLRQAQTFDAVWVDRSYFAAVLQRAGFERLVVDIDDLQSIFMARLLWHGPWYRSKPLHYAEVAKLYLHERALPRRFWRLVVCKEEDRRFFGRLRHKVFVVPNGVAEFPRTRPAAECPGEILYMGTMDYDPNVDAARFFARSVLPRVRREYPGTCFHVVGKDPAPEVLELHDGRGCVVHGLVPDVTPFYERASLVVAPIRQGSGTRLKVLEALARGKALVSTSTGAEGLNLRPGIDLEIADEPDAFARACVRLLTDPAARARLGDAGRQRVLECYRWDKVGRIAERVLTPPEHAPCANGWHATDAGRASELRTQPA
jgi:glycosyltransferase involved in cell wall biosynthesis